jgi:2-iminoacetate synthase ThiH
VPRERLVDLLRACDPLAAARTAAIDPRRRLAVVRGRESEDLLIDGDTEGAVADHRAAHAAGRPSEAAVAYGAGTTSEHVGARIDALAALARDTGLLRAVCPVPAEGDSARPGSWGVEDLTVIAVCRLALPDGVGIRPHWRRLGPAMCQVSLAFGASEWLIPADDPVDPAHLAEGVGMEFG